MKNLEIFALALGLALGAAIGFFIAYLVHVQWHFFGATMVTITEVFAIWAGLPVLFGIVGVFLMATLLDNLRPPRR